MPTRSLIVAAALTLTLAAASALFQVELRAAQDQAPGPPPQAVATPDAPAAGRAALGRIALGFVLVSAGSIALVLAAVYKGPIRLTLFSFGMFSLLYGVRILISVAAISPLLGVSRRSILFTVARINYLLPAFGLLFAEQIRGAGWLMLIRRFWQLAFVLAAGFITYDVYRGVPWASLGVYRPFLLVSMLVLLAHLVVWRQRDPIETSVRTAGTAVLTLAVIHDNLGPLLPWSVSLEVYGVSIFILALGMVTARRFFADQRELAAVERELATARTIQASILPRVLPVVPGLRLAVRYIPARSVAGDVYDFMPLADGQLGVLVADVAGHGVSAALIASMATVAFSSQKKYADDPSRMLGEINRVIAGHFDARYVTAAYLFIDLNRMTLRYSLAGHPPPLLLKASGAVMELTVGSTVLGVFDDAFYPAAEVSLSRGDRLVLYTDGLTEATNRAGEWFGEREFKRFVQVNAAMPVDAFIEALVSHVSAWGDRDGAAFDDDVTVLIVDFAQP